uniref:Insulin-like growth factor-binding protein 6 n=1 Tax=Pongo abelii TaxID=9601 RepID=A0A8I5TKK4_PONAB
AAAAAATAASSAARCQPRRRLGAVPRLRAPGAGGLSRGLRGGGGWGSPAVGCAEAEGCLRREGQECGVYTPNCAPGLQCHPPEDDEAPLRALLLGRGRCLPARAPAVAEENPKESKPQAGTARPQDVNRRDQQRNPGTSTTPSQPNSVGVQDTEMVRLELVGSRRGGKPWRLPSETPPLGLETSPLSVLGACLVGQKVRTGSWAGAVLSCLLSLPQGPCRRHLDSVLQQLQTEVYRGAQTLYVPNCDHRGFYRKRQCRSSQGQRRGPCWCVDRMGKSLPGSPDGNGSSSCPTGSSG